MKKLSSVFSFSAPLFALLAAVALGGGCGGKRAKPAESMSGSGDKMSGDKMSGDKMSGDKMSGDKMSGDKMSGDNKMSGDSHQMGSASGDTSMGSGHAM